jgi:two-component sensor histidine kinase
VNLVELGLLLYRSVHVLEDEDARLMREAAHRAGANAALIASALRLRDERVAADVQRVGVAS